MNRFTMLVGAALLAGSALAQTAAAPPAAPPAAATPAAAAAAPGTAAPAAASAPAAGAEVYFIAPRNGEKLHGPVTVRFGLKGMGVAPAGVKFDNTGHHHLLVDTDFSELKPDAALPATDKILHFGKGQTETTLNLAPGRHTLQIVFADFAHRSFDPPLHSKKITITVD